MTETTGAAAKAARENAEPVHWIIVADHRQAHVYKKTPAGIERIPQECLCCSFPPPGDEANDKAFLQDLAAWLAAAEGEKSFDRLALIAPAESLEALRALLGAKVVARICAARPRDIAEITESEIEDHLADVMWV